MSYSKSVALKLNLCLSGMIQLEIVRVNFCQFRNIDTRISCFLVFTLVQTMNTCTSKISSFCFILANEDFSYVAYEKIRKLAMEQNASRLSAVLKKKAEENGALMEDFSAIARHFVYGGSTTWKAPGPYWMYDDSVSLSQHHGYLTLIC